jgi:hypothetical protein
VKIIHFTHQKKCGGLSCRFADSATFGRDWAYMAIHHIFILLFVFWYHSFIDTPYRSSCFFGFISGKTF